MFRAKTNNAIKLSVIIIKQVVYFFQPTIHRILSTFYVNDFCCGAAVVIVVILFLLMSAITADCRDDKDIKKQFRRQNAVGNMLVRKFSSAPIEAKIQLVKSYCYPIYGCALWRHSCQNSIRKLTVSCSDTFKRLINVPRCTSSSLAFGMNATDHINVVFRKFAYSLMSRVIACPNSIVTAIANSDAYHQTPLMDKWESMLYV